MLKVGLTGGIGCGKTSASQLFAGQGIPVIDADIISRSLTEKDQPGYNQILKSFGSEIKNFDDTLNRSKLRNMIFSSPVKRAQLESILHPLIYNVMEEQMEPLKSPYVILSIPLLLETGMQNFVHRVLVIDCSVETQLLRVKARDQLSEERIQSIINTQLTREQRIEAANDIIDNSGSVIKLAEQIKKLHTLYISLSKSQEYCR